MIGKWALVLVMSTGFAMAAENVYKIPVDKGLEKWATFEISKASLRVRENGRVDIKYVFPKEVVGESTFLVEARGYAEDLKKPMTLVGKFATFRCQIVDKAANCRGDYDRKTMPVLQEGGVDRVKNYLKANITDSEELAGRFAVLEAFSHEAAGTFENLKVRFDQGTEYPR